MAARQRFEQQAALRILFYMFPVVSPGGIDPGLARRLEPADVTAPVGVQPVTLDPHAPRAVSLPVGAMQAQGVRVQAEPMAPPDLALAGRQRAEDQLQAGSGSGVNRAAMVAPQLLLLLQSLQQLGLVEAEGPSAMVAWPAAGQPVADTPAQALQNLRDTLGRSPLFAANPRTPAALATAAWRGASPAGADSLTQSAPELPTAAPAEALPSPTALAIAAQSPTALAGAAPAVDTTQQALQLLLHGQLSWSGELTPGVKARLQREDAWQEDPHRPGRLLQGSALRLEVELPTTGSLVVLAQQVGDQLSVRLLPGLDQALHFEAELSDLRSALLPLSDTPIDLALQAQDPSVMKPLN